MTLSKYMPSEPSLEGGDDVIYGIEISNEALVIDQLNDDIHEITKIGESLESLHNDIEEVGTLEGDARTYAQLAFECHLTSLGVEDNTVSVEDSIVDTLSNIWKAIVNAIKKAYRAIAEFFKRIYRFLTGKERDLKKERKRTEENEVDPKDDLKKTLEDVTAKNVKKSKALSDEQKGMLGKGISFVTQKQKAAFETVSSELSIAKDVLNKMSGNDYIPIDTSKLKDKDNRVNVTKVVKSSYSYVGYAPVDGGKIDSSTVSDFLKRVHSAVSIPRSTSLSKQTNATKVVMVDIGTVVTAGDELSKRIGNFKQVSKMIENILSDLEKDPKKALSNSTKLLDQLTDSTGKSTQIPCGKYVIHSLEAKDAKLNYSKGEVYTDSVYATKVPTRKELQDITERSLKVAGSSSYLKNFMKDYDKNVERLATTIVADDSNLSNDILLSIPSYIHKLLHLVYNEYLFSLGKAAADYTDGARELIELTNDLYEE